MAKGFKLHHVLIVIFDPCKFLSWKINAGPHQTKIGISRRMLFVEICSDPALGKGFHGSVPSP